MMVIGRYYYYYYCTISVRVRIVIIRKRRRPVQTGWTGVFNILLCLCVYVVGGRTHGRWRHGGGDRMPSSRDGARDQIPCICPQCLHRYIPTAIIIVSLHVVSGAHNMINYKYAAHRCRCRSLYYTRIIIINPLLLPTRIGYFWLATAVTDYDIIMIITGGNQYTCKQAYTRFSILSENSLAACNRQ